MKKNDNPYDDLDMWEDVLPRSRTQPSHKQNKAKNDPDDWDFFEGSSTPVTPRTPAKKRSPLPVFLAVAAVCMGAVWFLKGNAPSVDTPEPPHRDPIVLTTEPNNSPTIYLEPAVIATEPPSFPEPETAPQLPPAETTPPRDPASYRFYGRRLTDYGRELYDRIADCISGFGTSVADIQVQTLTDLEPVVQAVFYDYAEYFWFTGRYTYVYYERDGYYDVSLTPHYYWDIPTCQRNAAFVEQTVDAIIAPLYRTTDYEKVRYVYEYLIDHTAYDYAYTGKTIFEQLYDGRAVCAAYARSTQYMLTKLGIETIYVVGMGGPPGDQESHAWNIINLDGKYYQYDATWGDPYCEDGTQTKTFHYLLITDAESDKRHTPEADIFPVCNSIEYNYYVQESRYLDFYDLNILSQWIQESYWTNRVLEFKCANEWVYQDVVNNLLGKQAIFELFEQALGEAIAYSYSCNDELYIVKLEW